MGEVERLAALIRYEELLKKPIAGVEEFCRCFPRHIGGRNALQELKRLAKVKKALARMGHKGATVSGMTHCPRKGRCPTKRDLK